MTDRPLQDRITLRLLAEAKKCKGELRKAIDRSPRELGELSGTSDALRWAIDVVREECSR